MGTSLVKFTSIPWQYTCVRARKTAKRKAHIPKAYTHTIIFPVLSSGSGGRKGDEREKKRGRGRGGGENTDPDEAECCFALWARARPSLRASRTAKRITAAGCPGPNAAEGEESDKADRQRILFLLRSDFFFRSCRVDENNCVGRGDTRSCSPNAWKFSQIWKVTN